MNKQTLLYILCISLTLHYVSAQTGTYKQRYSNSDYFLNTQIDSLKNVTYGKAIDYMGDSQDLKMDVYFPNTNTDTLEKRPFILLIHGGGFTGGGRRMGTANTRSSRIGPTPSTSGAPDGGAESWAASLRR